MRRLHVSVPLVAAALAAFSVSTIPSSSYPALNAVPPVGQPATIARSLPVSADGWRWGDGHAPIPVLAAPPAQPVASVHTARVPPVASTASPRPRSRVAVAGGTPSVSGKWACIVYRESRGNPKAVNRSSGASGLVGFMDSTWHAMGMVGKASDYPADVQMAVAYRLQAKAGWSPWNGNGC